jgi:hypothetical protein
MDYSQKVLDLFNSKQVQERFWRKVNKTPDCWEWTSGKSKFGHGRFKLNRSLYSSHVLSIWSHTNEAPHGRFACHICDNPACVRPEHLWYGSASDNMKDAYKKGRLDATLAKANLNHVKGEKVRSCIITETQAIELLRFRKETGKGAKFIYKMFPDLGLSISGIEHLLYGKTWKHLER